MSKHAAFPRTFVMEGTPSRTTGRSPFTALTWQLPTPPSATQRAPTSRSERPNALPKYASRLRHWRSSRSRSCPRSPPGSGGSPTPPDKNAMDESRKKPETVAGESSGAEVEAGMHPNWREQPSPTPHVEQNPLGHLQSAGSRLHAPEASQQPVQEPRQASIPASTGEGTDFAHAPNAIAMKNANRMQRSYSRQTNATTQLRLVRAATRSGLDRAPRRRSRLHRSEPHDRSPASQPGA